MTIPHCPTCRCREAQQIASRENIERYTQHRGGCPAGDLMDPADFNLKDGKCSRCGGIFMPPKLAEGETK